MHQFLPFSEINLWWKPYLCKKNTKTRHQHEAQHLLEYNVFFIAF